MNLSENVFCLTFKVDQPIRYAIKENKDKTEQNVHLSFLISKTALNGISFTSRIFCWFQLLIIKCVTLSCLLDAVINQSNV